MPDEFWFEVSTTVDVFGGDGATVIGRLQADTPYRAVDADDHWLAIPGPNGHLGFVAIADLDYREVPAPGRTDLAETTSVRNGDAEEAARAVVASTPAHATPTGNDDAGSMARDQHAGPSDDDRLHDDLNHDQPTHDAAEATPHALDTSAYLHASSGATEPIEDADWVPRRQRTLVAGAVLGIIVLLFLISTFSGDSTPPTTSAASPTTSTTTTTPPTTTARPGVSTTVPAAGTTPASATAPRNWRMVFFNDFTTSRDAAFPVGEITASAEASIADGAYLVDIEAQRTMETLLQVPLTSRSAYFGATVGETRIEAGAHVCGLLFTTDEGLYVVSVNAEVASGPREYAIIDSTGNEVLPVTGSTLVKKGENHVALLVRTPKYRLYINGEEVARGKVDGTQFTGFGLTYGASSSGQCSFDDLEVWRPPVRTETTTDVTENRDLTPEG